MWQCSSDSDKGTLGRKVETFEDRWKSFPYRDQNWIPERGLFLFCEKWTWSYLNTSIAQSEPGHKGEISIFLDPVTGTMLFTKEDAGVRGEDVDFVMAIGDQYYVGYSPLDREKEMQVFELGSTYNFRSEAETHFEEYVKATENTREFASDAGNYSITGKEHSWSDSEQPGTHQAYLADVPFFFATLYQLNELSTDLRLPININLSRKIPPRKALLSYRHEESPDVMEINLLSVTDAEKHLDLTLYD